ncbi:hypothetical protein GGR53DRAFT_469612 [Hypoxylon sp. FL1150]|nr:hypothetical protein GGR53DRAFT_469612 [Hypoxylon sp. FL1150]
MSLQRIYVTPPPPYVEYEEEASMTQTSASALPPIFRKLEPYAMPPQVPTPDVGLFPPSWNLYHTLSWSGQPDLVLHRGPSDTLPPLAAGTGGVGVGRHSVIVLPALPNSRLDSSQELLLRVDEARKKWRVRFRFAIEVGPDPHTAWRREVFEWRHSHGDAVSAFLDGAKAGWKLVRLADSSGDEGGGRLVWPRSSDGCEIVAVWAHARLSFTKVLKFRFLGSGATGALGDRWAIMAVMTALRMYQHNQRNRNGDW